MKKLFLLILLLFMAGPVFATDHFGFTVDDGTAISIGGAGGATACTGSTPCGLQLEGQSNWFFYHDPPTEDAPETAWNNPGDLAATGVIPLPRNLVAGTYHVFVNMRDYDDHRGVTVTVSGATSTMITTDDRDFNRTWSDAMTLVVATPDDAITLNLGTGTLDKSRIVRGLYITSDLNVTITYDGVAVNLVTPTVMDDSTAVKGNLISNGGFETGIDAIWGWGGNGEGQTVPVQGMGDCTAAWEGSCSLKWEGMTDETRIGASNAEELYSRVFHVKPNKTYTLSGYFKSSPGTAYAMKVGLENTFIPCGTEYDLEDCATLGFDERYIIESSDVTLNDSTWTRVSVTGYLLEYPTSDYQIHLHTQMSGVADKYILVDGLQLEEGEISAYAASATVEAAVLIDSSKTGNVFWDTDTIEGTLTVRNNSAGTLSKTLGFEIYDVFNVLVDSGTVAITSIASSTTTTQTFDLSANGKQGLFRLVTWIEGMDKTERELNYAIVPEPPSGADPTSYLGFHPNYSEHSFGMQERLGVKWARAMSPEASIGRWNLAEPSDDSFVFQDPKMALADDADVTSLITLSTNRCWPEWANLSGTWGGCFANPDQGDLPNPDEYAEFCGQMATHYGPGRYWEIWNEPFLSHGADLALFTVEVYAELLKKCTDAIKTADATAKVIGFGGQRSDEIQETIDELEATYLPTWDWTDHIDYIATHVYPGGPYTGAATILSTYGIPIWNTESGAKDAGFKVAANGNFAAWGANIWPDRDGFKYYDAMTGTSSFVAKAFVEAIGSGLTKYFYYDFRNSQAPNSLSFASLQRQFTVMDYDLTPKAKGVALSIANNLIDHSTTLGDVSGDVGWRMWMFDAPDAPIAAVYSTDYSPRKVTLSLSAGQFEVLDMMGNPISITGTDVPFGRNPVYVRGIGISAATLSSAMSGGTVDDRTDTEAPHLTIADGPRGPLLSGEPFRMRWIALDDTSYPNEGEIVPESLVQPEPPDPLAITYAYRLVGYDADWSEWVGNVYADYESVPDGAYTFEVKTKDQLGNTSSTLQRTILIGDASAPDTRKVTPRIFRKN